MKGRSNTDALAFSEFILTLMFWLAKPKSEKIYNLLKGSESNVQLTNVCRFHRTGRQGDVSLSDFFTT